MNKDTGNNIETNNGKKYANVEVGLVITSVVILIGFIILMVVNPEGTIGGISGFFWEMIAILGPFFEVFTFVTFLLAIFLCVSKYGKIRLGDTKPEFSTSSYIIMMILASLASSAIAWSFYEWVYYYTSPGLGIEPLSQEALETALPYQFYHWGIVNQAMYTVLAVAIGYGVYVRKVSSFQTSAVCTAMLGEKVQGKSAIGKVIDFVVIFGILGALSSSLGLGVPLASEAAHRVFGIEVTSTLQVAIIVIIGLIYTFTSYLGTHKGMKVISNLAAILTGIFLLYVLFFSGAAEFIFKNIVNSLGITIDQSIRMTLFTDPIGNTGFAEGWTIYFQAFYLNYLAMMAIFIAKVSKGRTIREVALATMLGITSGSIILFGVLGSFSINTFVNGEVDVVGLVTEEGITEQVGLEVISTLPMGAVIGPIAILILIICFLVPSLDSASLALAETATKRGTPPMLLRIFFCVLLAIIPMSIVLTDVGFDAIKYIAIIISVPFIVIVIIMEIGLLKWLKEDSRNGLHRKNIELQEKEADEEAVAKGKSIDQK